MHVKLLRAEWSLVYFSGTRRLDEGSSILYCKLYFESGDFGALIRLIERERDGLVINDLPTVESKAPSHFGGVLLASARYAPLAPDKGYNTHDTLSGVHRSLGALF